MIHSGTKTVTTAGTPVALASAHTPASWVMIQSAKGNTGPNIYVGDSTAIAAGAQGTAITAPLGSLLFPVLGAPLPYDLALIFIDADHSGDSVTFNYGKP